MTRSKTLFVVATGFLIGTHPLFAQEVGDRVRVMTDAGSGVIGRIVAVESDAFDVSVAGGQASSFAHADILRLERSLGSRSRWKEGLLYGGGGAFVAGFAVAVTLITTTCEAITVGGPAEECADDRVGFALAYGGVLGVVGGVLGMGVGALIKGPERWEEIRFGNVGVGFRPIFDLRWDRGHPGAVIGVRLRL